MADNDNSAGVGAVLLSFLAGAAVGAGSCARAAAGVRSITAAMRCDTRRLTWTSELPHEELPGRVIRAVNVRVAVHA